MYAKGGKEVKVNMTLKFIPEIHFKRTAIGEIPKDWEVKKIRDFYNLKYGITVSSNVDGNCRLLRQTDLKEGTIDPASIPYAEIEIDKIEKYLLKEDDLVISRIANVGSIGYVDFRILKSVDKPLIFGSYLLKFEKVKEIHNKFTFYFLFSSQMQDYIKSIAEGSTRQNTNAKVAGEFPLCIPPSFDEQSRIATVLSWFDDLIENKKRQNEILEKTAMAIFKSWFVDFEPFQNEEFVYSEELGREIPKGWEVKKLRKVVRSQYGFTASAEERGEIKFLRIMDINKSFVIDWDVAPFCSIKDGTLSKYQLKDGDIVISRIGDIGKVAIIENPPKGVFASYLIRLNIKDSKITPYYLYYWLKGPDYQKYIQGAAEGSTRQNTNAEVIKAGPILIPSQDVLKRFEKIVFSLRQKIILNQKEIMILRKARDALLPKLVFGKIRVVEI